MRMKPRLGTVILLVSMVCGTASARTGVIDIADYTGRYDTRDMTPFVYTLLESLPADKPVKLVFPQGTYHFRPEFAAGKYHCITNHDNGYRHFAFPLTGRRNIEIDGGGAEFIFHGRIIPFLIEDSHGVTLRNFTVDWEVPFTLEAKVTAADAETQRVEIEIPDEFGHAVENGKLIMRAEGWEERIPGENIVFDPGTMATAYRSDDYYIPKPDNFDIRVTPTASGRYELHTRFVRALPPVGTILTFKGVFTQNRHSPAIHATASSGVLGASFACLAQVSFASQQYAQDSAPYLWMIACVLVAIPSGLILLARNSYPQAVFWTACLLVVALPYDSLIALMALTSLLARRQGTKVTLRSVLAAATTTIWSQVRDALHPAEASIWHAIFSKPYTGVRYGNTMVMLVDERTIIASAVVVALIAVAIATLAGLHIRSRALARVAEAKAQSANEQVSRLRTTLDNQQLADAIAAEAHDTLAHSLSLLALNASALQAESRKLKAEAEQLGNANVAGMAGKIAGTTEDIRRQASGALDEAHSVIDMLRHPEDARLQLAANDAEASLTRDSLLQLIGDARAANMRIDTWIDVQQLGQLDESIGVIAYHVVQEGLTNVRRHAPGAPVSLQVDANPPQGVHVHVSNPTMPQSPSHMADTRKGAGLPGLAKRIQQAGGTCQYGFDQHNVFHLDVRLPWVG